MSSDSRSLPKPVPGRPRDPRIDAAILAAAAELLIENGYADLTMAAVAERAGTTKTALYRRWSSKAELVHEAAFAIPPPGLASSPGGAMPAIEAMIAATRDVFTGPVMRAALPGLLADMAGDAELTARVLKRFDGHFAALRVWVADGVRHGEVRGEVDSRRLLEVIGGAVVFGLLLQPGNDLGGDWVEQISAIIAHGVMT